MSIWGGDRGSPLQDYNRLCSVSVQMARVLQFSRLFRAVRLLNFCVARGEIAGQYNNKTRNIFFIREYSLPHSALLILKTLVQISFRNITC